MENNISRADYVIIIYTYIHIRHYSRLYNDREIYLTTVVCEIIIIIISGFIRVRDFGVCVCICKENNEMRTTGVITAANPSAIYSLGDYITSDRSHRKSSAC